MRNLNNEFRDTNDRKYAYDFDYILRDYMIRSLMPHFIGDKQALEMGCYQGEFSKSLLLKFEKLTVLEGSSELIAFAKKNVNSDRANFVHGMFESAKLPETYDNIFLIHTLEHLDDPVVVLKKIRSWLSEKGRLFLVCPNANAASRQLAVKMGLITHNSAVTEGEREHGHRKTYSLDTLEAEAQAAGFNIVIRGGIFFKPLANFQFDKVIKEKIIDKSYLDACYELGMIYPDLTASIYVICEK